MSFICIVCREVLSKSPWAEVDDSMGAVGGLVVPPLPQGPVDIVSTKCGHMYHLICLTDWFNKQQNPRQECPYCKNPVLTGDYQRIYPIGDEETDDIDTRLKNAKKVVKESVVLKNEMEQFKNQLEETEAQLENQTLVMDILQFEYREKCFEADGLQAKVEEDKKVQSKIEKQWIETLKKTEEEKNALDREVKKQKKNLLLLQTELDRVKDAKTDQENVPTNLIMNLSQNQENLLEEIRSLQQNFQNGFTPAGNGNETGNGTGNGIKKYHAMASQTDSSLFTTEKIFNSLSKLEMHDIFIEFLKREKTLLESSNNGAMPEPDPPAGAGGSQNQKSAGAMRDSSKAGVSNNPCSSARLAALRGTLSAGSKISQELPVSTIEIPTVKVRSDRIESNEEARLLPSVVLPKKNLSSQTNGRGTLSKALKAHLSSPTESADPLLMPEWPNFLGFNHDRSGAVGGPQNATSISKVSESNGQFLN